MAEVKFNVDKALNSIMNMITGLKNLRKAAKDAGASELAGQFQSQQLVARGLYNEMKRLVAVTEQQAEASKKAAKESKKQENAYERLVRKEKEARLEAQKLAAETNGFSLKAALAARRARVLARRLEDINRSTRGASRGMKTLKSMMTSVAGLVSLYVVVGYVKELAVNVFNLTKKLNAYNFAMEAVITNEMELIQTKQFLREITNAYGADLLVVTDRYVKFRAASQNAGLSLKETQKIFGTMTKAAGVLGLQSHELQGIFLALEQMISKGKITTEELRRQLGERLPGAMDIMADSMGISIAELDKMMKKGEVITKDVLPKFAEQVEKAFGIEQVEKVNTLAASQQRLSNAWINFINVIESSEGRISKPIMEFFEDIVEVLHQLEVLNRTDQEWLDIARADGYENAIKRINEEYVNLKEQMGDTYDIKDLAGVNMSRYLKNLIDSKEELTEVEKISKRLDNYNSTRDGALISTLRERYNLQGLNTDKVIEWFREHELGAKKQVEYWEGMVAGAKSFWEIKKETQELIEDGPVDTSAVDLEIQRLQQRIELEKEIRDNIIYSTELREQAAKKVNGLEIALIESKAKRDIMLAEDNINKKLKAEEKAVFDKSQLEKEMQQKEADLAEEYLKELIEKRAAFYDNQVNTEVALIKEKYAKIGPLSKSEEEKMNKEINEVKLKYGNEAIISQVELIKEGLKNLKLEAEVRAELERKIQKLLAGIRNQVLDDDEDYFEAKMDLIQEFTDAIADIVVASFDRRIEAIEAEMRATEDSYARKIKLAEDDAAQREALEVELQDKIAILEKRRLRAEQRKARFQKAKAISDVAINTAVAITKLPADGGFLGLAAVPAMIALGALQTAAILAQPIPQYKDGLENAKSDHIAKINDGGKQEYIERNGQILTTNKSNAIVQIKKGDTVYKDFDEMSTRSMLLSAALNGNQISEYHFNTLFDGLSEEIQDGFSKAKIDNKIIINEANHSNYADELSRW